MSLLEILNPFFLKNNSNYLGGKISDGSGKLFFFSSIIFRGSIGLDSSLDCSVWGFKRLGLVGWPLTLTGINGGIGIGAGAAEEI